jgi:SP family general alpha glucoside:H+ symporter-like MFS transporter
VSFLRQRAHVSHNPIGQFGGLILTTEWLTKQERLDEARRSLVRLAQKDTDGSKIDETLVMKHTNDVEKYLSNEGMSFMECFRGVNLRRTEIACMVWAAQALSGNALAGYAAYFYQQEGFSAQNSFNLSIGLTGLGIVGNIIASLLLPSIGRRKLYLCGLFLSFIIFIIAGGIAILPQSNARSWTLGSLIVSATFVYNITIGPVCYILVAEIPSSRLRVKTVVIARVAYIVSNLALGVLIPRMLNPTAWNWKGKAGFFFSGTSLICFAWSYWRLPELFGLSYLEIDILFERRAKPSKFRELQANLESAGYFSLTRTEQPGCLWRGY